LISKIIKREEVYYICNISENQSDRSYRRESIAFVGQSKCSRIINDYFKKKSSLSLANRQPIGYHVAITNLFFFNLAISKLFCCSLFCFRVFFILSRFFYFFAFLFILSLFFILACVIIVARVIIFAPFFILAHVIILACLIYSVASYYFCAFF